MANRCDQCGDEFPSTAALVQHFSSHTVGSKSGEGERAQPTPRRDKGGAVRSATASASRGSLGKDSRVRKAKISTPISQLPREMIGKIFSYLDLADIVNCANVCRDWLEIAAQLHLQPSLVRMAQYHFPRYSDCMKRMNRKWSFDCLDSEIILHCFEGWNLLHCGRVLTVKASTAEVIDLMDPKFKRKINLGVDEDFLGRVDEDFLGSVDEDFLGKEHYQWCNGFLMDETILLHGYNPVEEFLYVLGQSKVCIKFNFDGKRDGPSGIIKVNETSLLRVGGTPRCKAMELIHFDPTNEENPFRIEESSEFPHEIYGHAMIKYSSDEVMVIGGRMFDYDNIIWTATDHTWIIDTSNECSIREGPRLDSPRSHHSVGSMVTSVHRPYGNVIVLIGGSSIDSDGCFPDLNDPDDYAPRTAEFLHPVSQQWDLLGTMHDGKIIELREKPSFIGKAMIPTPDSTGVVLVGVGNEGKNLKELSLHFIKKENAYSGDWKTLKHLLDITAGAEVAIPIPYGFDLSTIEGKGGMLGDNDQGMGH